MKKIVFICIALILSESAIASRLIVISAKENVENINLDDVSRIFLGKVTQYPSGRTVTPITPDPKDPSYELFAKVVLKKNISQMRAYWAKKIFTGKGRPPQVVATTKELQALVASDKRYLSYIDRNDVVHDVRWVIEVP